MNFKRFIFRLSLVFSILWISFFIFMPQNLVVDGTYLIFFGVPAIWWSFIWAIIGGFKDWLPNRKALYSANYKEPPYQALTVLDSYVFDLRNSFIGAVNAFFYSISILHLTTNEIAHGKIISKVILSKMERLLKIFIPIIQFCYIQTRSNLITYIL